MRDARWLVWLVLHPCYMCVCHGMPGVLFFSLTSPCCTHAPTPPPPHTPHQASELQQLKLAEAKEDVVDHKEKLEQGALAEEVREILSMQRLADEQESEQVNGLLANLLVKNGLNIAVLVGIVYFLFVRADDGGGGDDGNDGTGDGRSGGRHSTGGGRRHGRGWRRGGARHNSSRGNSRRDGDGGGGGGGGDGNGGGRWASRFWPESWDLARNDKSHDNNQQNDQQPHEDNAPVDAGGARGAWPSSRLAPSSYERNLPLAGPRLHVASIDRTDGDGDNLSVGSTYSTDPFSGRRQLQIEGPGGGDGLKPPSHGSLRSNRASRISSTSRTHSFKSHGGGGGRSGIRSSRGSFRTKAM